MTPWVRYSIIRIGLFAVLFALLMVTGIEWWISALVATVMAFTISYIFFVRQRDALARDLARRVERKNSSDDDAAAEDDAVASEGDGASKS
jgi:hypothetical protein